MHATLCQRSGHRDADATARPSDERDLPMQILKHIWRRLLTTHLSGILSVRSATTRKE
jgi:hypothetical protein